jgi:hypothetical protein
MRSDSRFAVLARSVQWELDEAAFELGGGRYTREQRQQLAGQLVALTAELRAGEQPALPGLNDE